MNELAADQSQKPILVKVAPDLSFEALDEILELAGPRQTSPASWPPTRPSPARKPLTKPCRRVYAETGGLSGRPLRARSTEIIRHSTGRPRGKLPIIGVGGIFTRLMRGKKLRRAPAWCRFTRDWFMKGPAIAKDYRSAACITRLGGGGFDRLAARPLGLEFTTKLTQMSDLQQIRDVSSLCAPVFGEAARWLCLVQRRPACY